MDSTHTKTYFIAAIVSFLYLLISQIIGSVFFDNNWAFLIWENVSRYYLIGCTFIIYIFGSLVLKRDQIFDPFLQGMKLKILGVILFVSFVLFQIDSFVFAGGNHYLNELAQSKLAVIRFYDFFSIALVKLFFSTLLNFDLHYNTAGVISFRIFSYLATIGSLIFAYLISTNLHTDKKHRIFIFIILFLGPQSLMYFGFIGIQPIIVTSMFAYLYVATSYIQKPSGKSLLLLFSVTILSLCFHIASLVLVPLLLFFIVKHFIRKKSFTPFIIGLISYIILFTGLYSYTSENLELSKYILFTDNNLFHPYNLQSLNHIGDIIMLALLFFPQLIALKFLFFKQIKSLKDSSLMQALLLLSITCNTLIVIIEPVHSIMLDSPVIAIFLTPMAFMLAYLSKDNLKALKHFALLTLVALVSYIPVFNSLERTEGVMKDYLEKNNHLYIESGTALQDSYFYQKKINEANYWYTNLDKFSQDFLDLTAAAEYTSAEMYPDAQRLLLLLKNKFKYWVEPRIMNIEIELVLKRFVSVKKEIDSTLLLEPYNKKVNHLLYNYYRDLGDFVAAENQINKLGNFYPYDYDIKTDQAIINYRLKNFITADSIAAFTIAHDSTQAFSYLIRGFIAEINKNPNEAIDNFEKFIKYAPDEPETPSIRKRLNELILQSRN